MANLDDSLVASSDTSSVIAIDFDAPSRCSTPRPGDITPRRREGLQTPKKRYQKAGLFSPNFKDEEYVYCLHSFIYHQKLFVLLYD